jgi:hypothetical protein
MDRRTAAVVMAAIVGITTVRAITGMAMGIAAILAATAPVIAAAQMARLEMGREIAAAAARAALMPMPLRMMAGTAITAAVGTMAIATVRVITGMATGTVAVEETETGRGDSGGSRDRGS